MPSDSDLFILTYSCPLKWDELRGTHAIKHCDQCSLKVHNITYASEEVVAELFKRSLTGERVCIRSEVRGPRTIANRSRLIGITTVISVAASWFIGLLKVPVFAYSTKVSTGAAKPKKVRNSTSRNVVQLEDEPGRDLNQALATLSTVDRYGFGVSVPRSSSDAKIIWGQIKNLRLGTAFEKQSTPAINRLRNRVVERAEKDRVIAIDEVIELSNKYRSVHMDSAADQALGLAVTLLNKHTYWPFIDNRLVNARIGEVGAQELPAFGYSQTKEADFAYFNRLLRISDEHWNEKQYLISQKCLMQAMSLCWNKPLLIPEIRKTNFQNRIAQLKPFIPEDQLSQLIQAHEAVQLRVKDLSKLKPVVDPDQ